MTTPSTKATPRPWEIGDDGEGLWWITGPDKNANVICDIVPRGKAIEPSDEDYANATLIVEAVNAHDTLLAERDRLRRELELAAKRLDFLTNWIENTYHGGGEDVQLGRSYAEAARTALKEGE